MDYTELDRLLKRVKLARLDDSNAQILALADALEEALGLLAKPWPTLTAEEIRSEVSE
jgi:hypothetical protein